MIAAKQLKGQCYAVLGLGRTGLSAANALIARGADVIAWDDGFKARETAKNAGIEVLDLKRFRDWPTVTFLIVSPGISHLYPDPHPVVSAAMQQGVLIDNDIGLFFRSFASSSWLEFEIPPKVIAVTGSNGKSTTSALIYHILEKSGRSTQLAGNIGRPVLDIDPPQDGEIVVLELSSYQIELARALTPDIAVFTNFSRDHLDRHNGEGGYFAAKKRLFTEGVPDRAIIGIDEIEGLFLANQIAESCNDDRVIRISSGQRLDGPSWQIFVRKGFLSETRKGRQLSSVDLRGISGLPGAHNHQNAAAAFAACRVLGISPKLIASAMASFPGLAHRSQFVGNVCGVNFVNDSKATNVASAVNALTAFQNIRWICGGLEKEGGLKALKGMTGAVRKAYVIGREASQFAMQLDCSSMVNTTMSSAVEAAFKDAEPGDTILLAPAAASFDQYDNFERRGEDFIAAVQRVAVSTN